MFAMADFAVKFKSDSAAFDVSFGGERGLYEVGFGEVNEVSKEANYDGEYIVTPKLEEQTMPTKGKVMEDDVKINKIPITVVSNESGGNTVIIGG